MPLADNQYFNTENKNFIILFTIVPDRALNNKDSLLKDSRRAYNELLLNLGKRMENENMILPIGEKRRIKIMSASHTYIITITAKPPIAINKIYC